MADNKVCNGSRMEYTNSSGATILSSSPVLVGATFGVAVADIPDGETGVLDLEGVYEIRKVTGAINQGVKLYWDADGNPLGGPTSTGCLTTVDSGNTLVGKSFAAAGSTATVVQISLNA